MDNLQDIDHYWMNQALECAEQAAAQGEVPVGAVIVKNNHLVSNSYNLRESSQQAIAHAEILAIEQACQKLGQWRLQDCDLYVTLEPCVMCAGAILQSRVKRVVFATPDPKAGGVTSLYSILSDPRMNHQCEIVSGILREKSARLLKDFFAKLRLNKANQKKSDSKDYDSSEE